MECLRRYLYVAAVLVALLLSTANSTTITVDAHDEQCFFENVNAHTKLGLTFETAEGGFRDIDVSITGPNGAVIYKDEGKSSGEYTFSTPTSGRYTYCFSNKMSTGAPKVVKYNVEVGG